MSPNNGTSGRRGGIEQRIRVRLMGRVAALLIFISSTVEAFSATSSTRRGTRLFVSTEDTTGTEKTKASNAERFDWFQQWYPAIPLSCLEEQQGHIQSKPHSCTILDKTIAIWNSGTTKDGVTQSWSAVDDTCPHRRAALSTGKVVGSRDGSCNLACRYHGWQFNSTGACVKIPALDRNLTASDSRAFKTLSYPTKLSNGMLWVFLDPTMPHDALPEIPTGALIPEEEYNDKVWTHFFFVTPVSHLSMTENAFDPFHAPFVHQGESEFGGLNYSPSRATPMKRYQLMGDVSKEGFVLEHTPYETDDPPDEITTREFVSPCSTITKKPNSEIRIHFVPQSARETRVIFMLGMPKPKNAIQRLGYRIFASDTVHTLFQLNDGSTRFADQDRIIMQGQDERKMDTGTKWRDLYPTTSDAGVAAYQRWIQMFGAPFRTDQIVETQKANSMWERHGKHCSQCQRSLRRLTQLRALSSRFSSISLLLSGLTSFASIGIKSKFCPPLSVSILLLVAGVLLRVVKSWTVNTEAKMYSEEGAKRHIDEVYTF